MTPAEIATRVRVILAELLPNEAARIAALSDDETVWRTIAPMRFVELVEILELTFGIVVLPVEYARENLASLGQICAFVHGKLDRR